MSRIHSRSDGAIHWCTVGPAVMSAPETQNAAKISHVPSVLRTSRIVATAAPDSTAAVTPTSCQLPNATIPGGALPAMTMATPTVVMASAPSVGDRCARRETATRTAP